LATTVSDINTAVDPAAVPIGSTIGEMGMAIERLREAMITQGTAGTGKAATTAMANLAEAIQGLVHHMRTEQQMIRDWVDSGRAAPRGQTAARVDGAGAR